MARIIPASTGESDHWVEIWHLGLLVELLSYAMTHQLADHRKSEAITWLLTLPQRSARRTPSRVVYRLEKTLVRHR